MLSDDNVLGRRKVAKETDVLIRPRDTQAGDTKGGGALNLVPVEHDRSGGWVQQSGNQIEHGCLAGAIWTDQAHNARGLQVQAQ